VTPTASWEKRRGGVPGHKSGCAKNGRGCKAPNTKKDGCTKYWKKKRGDRTVWGSSERKTGQKRPSKEERRSAALDTKRDWGRKKGEKGNSFSVAKRKGKKGTKGKCGQKAAYNRAQDYGHSLIDRPGKRAAKTNGTRTNKKTGENTWGKERNTKRDGF